MKQIASTNSRMEGWGQTAKDAKGAKENRISELQDSTHRVNQSHLCALCPTIKQIASSRKY